MLLIIAAVPFETSLIRGKLQNCQTLQLGSTELLSANLNHHQLLLTHSGVGQPAMALQLTRLLESYQPATVLLCGCGGSYPGSALNNGALVIASEEVFGDFGVANRDHFIPAEQLDIPHLPGKMLPCQERLPLDEGLAHFARKTLPEARYGTFVTVNSCSGHERLSLELAQRTGGICENMEGAAAALVCAEYGVPLLEIRGISNPTGTRDPKLWDLKMGAEAAQNGLLKLLQNWPEDTPVCN